MKPLELLATKEIKDVSPARVGFSITQGGKLYWRFTASLPIETFKVLFNGLNSGLQPHSLIHGTCETGLAIQLTTHTGGRVNQNGKTTVVTYAPAKAIEATENKVSLRAIDCLLVKYRDGSTALLTPTFPEEFFPTRAKSRALKPMHNRAYIAAYKRLHGREPFAYTLVAPIPTRSVPEYTERVDPVRVTEPVFEEPSAPPEVTVITGQAAPQAPNSLADVRTMIEMINDAVRELKTKDGQEIVLRVENGELKARVAVTKYEEL